MSARKEYTRPYSAEYLHATGCVVQRMFDGPFREYVDSGYVRWLEEQLKTARAFVPRLKGE